MATFGFIGTGNMGGALATAAAKVLAPQEILLANRTPAKAETLAKALGCKQSTSAEIASTAQFIFLGVKPQMMQGLLSEIFITLNSREDDFVLVTMAAGLTMADITRMSGSKSHPVIRIMPNTPAAIGEGVVLYCANDAVTPAEMDTFLAAMAACGLLCPLAEHLIDAGSAVSGCGPAFVDLFIEALADGGVSCGLPRAQALMLAAQMVAGSAKLVLESGKHPAVLKDAVCSPGGSTIAGVAVLEDGAFRATVLRAVQAAFAKNKQLGK